MVGLGVLQSAAGAQISSADTAVNDAQAWLLRSREAALTRNYQGTLVVSGGGTVSSSRVAHYAEGSQQYERIEALDGEARSLWRFNETVQTVWPQAHVAVVEQRGLGAAFPAMFSSADRRVLDSYEMRPLGHDRVAGYDADVVLLKARDNARFSQRLWAEHQTGLLLRLEILGPNGQSLEAAAFSELVIGVKPQIEQIRNAMRSLEGYRVLRPAQKVTHLDKEGWSVLELPVGFREVFCTRRSLDPWEVESAPTVVQVIFSDGLTHVSLFIEPFQPQRHQAMVHAVVGATHTLTGRLDDFWVTAMGDVPMETLKRFAASLERKR
jgi:sigma-E factor negative regulatory protein RseB